jgi:predicted RNA-binding protein YlxR (DUF448 family)
MLGRPHYDARDLGPRKRAAGTQRFCVATGAIRPVDEMIRFVIGPDGTPVPDLKRRLPGRGIWITATRAAVHTAITRKAFARTFKRDVRLNPDLVQATERLIERTALDALAICHKAGNVAIRLYQCRSGARSRPRSSTSRRCRGGSRWREKAHGRLAPARGRGGNRRDRCIYLGAIGFGIGAGKCDTCSPARRS